LTVLPWQYAKRAAQLVAELGLRFPRGMSATLSRTDLSKALKRAHKTADEAAEIKRVLTYVGLIT
jgi:hypothetical protein